ncbi:MAG TPA: hypothetical protein VGJ05_04860 [Fimbriiglobus sp.]|jgi:hypothetical protein
MTCDVSRNRLLALPDLTRLTDDLRAHLAACEACTAWLVRAKQLDLSLVNLPAPNSDDAKTAFLESLAADGPIIRTIPRSDRTQAFSFVALARRLDWRVVSGLAASVAVGVGIWGLSGPGKKVAEVAGPKHELLAQSVDFVTSMSTATNPQDRTRLSMTMAGDLRDEVKELYTVAKAEDLNKLADLYERVVKRGLIGQSRELARIPVQERHALWREVQAHLAAVVQDASEMQAKAPPPALPSLAKIKKAALDGQAVVNNLIANGRG